MGTLASGLLDLFLSVRVLHVLRVCSVHGLFFRFFDFFIIIIWGEEKEAKKPCPPPPPPPLKIGGWERRGGGGGVGRSFGFFYF